MENIKAYIESGILELYVMGDLSAQEVREVEDMIAKYPELRLEIEEVERSLEHYAKQNAVMPSSDLKDKILNSLEGNINPVQIHQEKFTPAEKPKVVPLHQAPSSGSKVKNLQYALAACIGLLIVSVVALFSAHTELGEAKEQIAGLSQQNQKYTNAVNFMQKSNDELQKVVDMGENPDWAKVQLAGVGNSPDAQMTVYWNKKNQDVMVVSSKMKLPTHDADHQYQLWAIVNGKPVDLGVFDNKTDSSTLLLRMKEVSAAQAFAVTLEKRGGNPTPTMEQMVVMGGVTI